MKHLIAYNDVKAAIDGVLPDASHSLYSLVKMFQECDDQFMKLVNEKTELSQNKELSISASELFDAYELVEDAMNTMGMLIANVGQDENRGLHQYANVSEFIEPAKELIPSLVMMIHTVSSQMSDFIELHKSFMYQSIDQFNPIKVHQYIEINNKVARISAILRDQMVEEHGYFVNEVQEISSHLTETNMIHEAKESVKGEYFVSLIDGISIIEVGETESEVLKKTREYFDGSVDDTITIKPSSKGIYHMVKDDGEIPEEWEIVNGVVVLPEERELFERAQSGSLTESRGVFKAAIKKIHNDVEEKVKSEFSSRVLKIDGVSDSDTYTIKIIPDMVVEKKKFNTVDKKVVLEIYRKMKDHPWFKQVKLDELENGTITLTLIFDKIDFMNAEKSIVEEFQLS